MITIDIDGKTRKVKLNRRSREILSRDQATIMMLIAYFGLRHVFPRRDVFVHITRRGYHLICYGYDGDLERERGLRRVFGDDPFRIDIDRIKQEKGSFNFNVMWTQKGEFRTKEIDPLSLDVVRLDQYGDL